LVLGEGDAAAVPLDAAGAGGAVAAGAAADGAGVGVVFVSAGATGGETTAAIVPPKIVTRPIAASAMMPVATTELVLTDTRGSIQSGR